MFIFAPAMKNLLLFTLALFTLLSTEAQVLINPCASAKDIHVVVIGSSTAAGTGPTNSANAWVNRYRAYLQNINSNNQVTNLAIGGTTTYHIMPDWFVAAPGRPPVILSNNVSQAITLGADAIIVNMPSNDAANGFGVNEQMFNFQTISNTADSAGIPVWVCTTQPKNFSAAQKAIQIAVRDSVISYFGPKAIDFWTGFADSTNGLATFYDSGDGTHMNDTAHGVLNNRVIAEGIPNIVSDTLAYTDHIVNNIYLTNTSICGDSNTMLHVVVTNLGLQSAFNESLRAQSFDNINSSLATLGNTNISQLGSCQSDTFDFVINSYNGIDQTFSAFINNSGDNDISNDTSGSIDLETQGHPLISGLNDTVNSGANALLTATTGSNDTIVWYDAQTGGNILGYGNQYPINNVTVDQTIYPEAVRGPLHFRNSLFTTANTTTDWNGVMFDIVALGNIVIDSLKIKLNANGPQMVEGYNRMGSIVGNEMIPTAWNVWGTDSVNAAATGDFDIVDFPDVSLQANDTLGVYVHMQNSNSRLSYLNSAAATYANTDVAVLNGTGVSYTFGGTYSPRNWSGEVFYHYGFNPQGDCSSERIGVSAIVRTPDGIGEISEDVLQIFPNPTSGRLSFSGDKIPSHIQVMDIQGRAIGTHKVIGSEINLSSLRAGLYMLFFEIEGATGIRKIILE